MITQKSNFSVVEQTSTKNKIAIALLILAKFSGLTAVGLGFAGFRTLGAALLILDGLLILSTVILALVGMQEQNKKDQENSNLLSKMLEDGSIYHQLKEIGLKVERS